MTDELLAELARASTAAHEGSADADDELRRAASEALDALMKDRGWSSRGLGMALGIDHGSGVSDWRHGKSRPPAWLALAIAAVDAGDPPPPPLDADALRDRMATAGWSSAMLGAVLGVERARMIRWRRGRATVPRGLGLAIAEAERRTRRGGRRGLPGGRDTVAARRSFERALRRAHAADRRLRSARWRNRPQAERELALRRAQDARDAVAAALRDALEAGGWSDGGLAFALAVGDSSVTSWRSGRHLPPAWLGLALAALDIDDEPGEGLDAAALRAHMAAAGWSVSRLAAALGVATAAMVRWRRRGPSAARSLTLAIAEAERRTPRSRRHGLPGG